MKKTTTSPWLVFKKSGTEIIVEKHSSSFGLQELVELSVVFIVHGNSEGVQWDTSYALPAILTQSRIRIWCLIT